MRAKATPEEEFVASSIASARDEQTKAMVVNLAASTYANVAATPDKRTITLLSSDELKFDNPRTPNGMTLIPE